ncbi:amino acid permease-domain-containing protein, partial [Terfezia claveryi]
PIDPMLDKWDVAALIINKMVGTGILTGPPLVLKYTQSRGEAMSLWILGLVYTYLYMFMYLGYAEVLPFIGGELLYLDAILSKPKMFWYILYGVSFVFLMNGATNCLQFGAQVFLADLKVPQDQRLVRLFAVCILTLVCFTIAYSNRLFRNTNKLFAVLKTVGMLVLFIGGAVFASAPKENHTTSIKKKDARPSSVNHFLALSYVLFAYSGWENATFVRAEVQVSSDKNELVQGFLIGGMTVGLGYIGINAIFLVAIGNTDVTLDLVDNEIFKYAPWLFGNGDIAKRFWAIATAISAVGSIASVMYTSAKVKQSMAASNVFPWSRLWIKQNRQISPTPAGAVLLHWISAVISITYTSAIPDLAQATAFPGFIQIYVQKFFGIFITLGYPLHGRRRQEDQDNQTGLQAWGVWIMVIVLCVCNIGLVISPCIPPYEDIYGRTLYIKGYTYPIVTIGLAGIAAIYYLLCFANPGDNDLSLLRLVGLKSEFRQLCKQQKRHLYFGYQYRVFITDPDASQAAMGPSSSNPAAGDPDIDPAVLIEEETFGDWLRTFMRRLFGWEILLHLDNADPYHGPNIVGCECYQRQCMAEVVPPQHIQQLAQHVGARDEEQVQPQRPQDGIAGAREVPGIRSAGIGIVIQ